jgi:hypothetical protein
MSCNPQVIISRRTSYVVNLILLTILNGGEYHEK